MPLGNILTDIEAFVAPSIAVNDLANAIACGEAAGTQTPSLDAELSDLSANWNPSNYFSPQDVDDLTTAQLTGPIQSAYNALQQAYADAPTSSYPNVTDLLDAAQTRLNNVSAQTQNYINAYKTAQAQNAVVSAPGFKAWVLETIAAAEQAIQATFVVECSQSLFASLLADVVSACSTFAAACKAVVGVVATAVKTVINAVETSFSLVQWLAKWWLWLVGGAVVIGLGFLAFKHRHRLKDQIEQIKSGE